MISYSKILVPMVSYFRFPIVIGKEAPQVGSLQIQSYAVLVSRSLSAVAVIVDPTYVLVEYQAQVSDVSWLHLNSDQSQIIQFALVHQSISDLQTKSTLSSDLCQPFVIFSCRLSAALLIPQWLIAIRFHI